jgi:antitoxin component of MazEF toxin-antitoxin module
MKLVMPTKLTKNGGSRFVRIPPEVVDIMGISTGQKLLISADGDEIKITTGE